MKKYPRIKTWKNQILVIVELDKDSETTEWYSLKELKAILKEQKEEERR